MGMGANKVPKQEGNRIREFHTGLQEEVGLTDCSVCLKNRRDMLFIPCGHVTCCAGCGLTVDRCSMCQQEIVSKAKVTHRSYLGHFDHTVTFVATD